MGRLQTLKPRLQTLGAQPSKQGGWASSRQGRTTTERGLGWDWQQVRERVLIRDHGLCQPCRRAGRLTTATAVDHIRNRADGGARLDEANCQSICDPCHKAKTAAEARRARGIDWFAFDDPGAT